MLINTTSEVYFTCTSILHVLLPVNILSQKKVYMYFDILVMQVNISFPAQMVWKLYLSLKLLAKLNFSMPENFKWFLEQM